MTQPGQRLEGRDPPQLDWGSLLVAREHRGVHRQALVERRPARARGAGSATRGLGGDGPALRAGSDSDGAAPPSCRARCSAHVAPARRARCLACAREQHAPAVLRRRAVCQAIAGHGVRSRAVPSASGGAPAPGCRSVLGGQASTTSSAYTANRSSRLIDARQGVAVAFRAVRRTGGVDHRAQRGVLATHSNRPIADHLDGVQREAAGLCSKSAGGPTAQPTEPSSPDGPEGRAPAMTERSP